MDVDHGQLVGRHLNRFAIVMDLHELAPVDRRATGGRDGRRRRDGMAAKTIYTELTFVRQWLNVTVTRRMLAASPVAGTKLVKPKPGPREYWRQEQLDAIVDAAKGPYKAAYLLMAETGMRIGEVVHLTHDDLTLNGPTPVAHIWPTEVVRGARPWRPKNGEQRAVPLSPRAVAMLRDLPRSRRWVIDRMDGTAATADLPANDRHILAYLKTVLAKLGLEGTNYKFRHSFCTIAVLAGVSFFTLRRWVGHIDEEALKIDVHIADEEAQVTMRQLAERRQAAGHAAKPARGQKGISKVSAKSRRSNMTRCSKSLGNKARSIRRLPTNGEGGILSGLFSTVSDCLRFLTQVSCPSTTCDRWLVLERSGPFWAKSGPFSKVSAKSSEAMPERVGLSARARGAARGIAIVPPAAVKGGAS